MHIIAGEFKGRNIPFNNKKQGNARVTSDFVKKAVFSSLGEVLPGKRFLDLFSCSGQIGLEACSRGAQVVMNEPDRKRSRFIAQLLAEWNLQDRIMLHSMPAEKLLPQLAHNHHTFDIVYLDPPYHEHFNDLPAVVAFLHRIIETPILKPNAHIVVQHATSIHLPDIAFNMAKQKKYGDTTVSIFSV
ncbi:MAG: RsmD family RNA methyltransferase [Candidatus Latescibacteria bacterium]|jgi:16S rRNA (guanine(966)-N(2))-methyltransferase RsmD|nr:RsmD family RNA methyltransferase [Candidatus Latescibacterota bacterium]